MYGLVPASAVALSPSFMMVAMLKSVRCACPARREDSMPVPRGRVLRAGVHTLAALGSHAWAHLAHPGECYRASRLCRKSRKQGDESKAPGRAGGSHELGPKTPSPPGSTLAELGEPSPSPPEAGQRGECPALDAEGHRSPQRMKAEPPRLDPRGGARSQSPGAAQNCQLGVCGPTSRPQALPSQPLGTQ